jgi:hypothetical protein
VRLGRGVDKGETPVRKRGPTIRSEVDTIIVGTAMTDCFGHFSQPLFDGPIERLTI